MKKIKKFFNFKEMSKQKKVLSIAGLASIVVLALYLIIGGSSSSKGVDLIPKNAFAVGVVSVGDIIDKADIDDLKKLDLDIIEEMLEKYDELKEEAEEESELSSSILKNPYEIGIDINQDIFIYGVLEDMEKEEVYLCISGGVDDEDRLLDILKEIEDETNEFDIEEEDNYHIALTKGSAEVMAFAWDNDKFLFITHPDKGRWDKDDIENLEDEVERLFNLKSNEKLTSISSFNSFYNNKTDLCAWASVEGMDEGFLGPAKIVLSLAGLQEKDLKECSASLFFNLGDGDVSLKAAFYPSEGVKELLEKRSQISTSELSFELTMKFDDSGDNTLHVLLRSLLTIADEAKQFMDSGDIDDILDDVMGELFGGYGEAKSEDSYDERDDYNRYTDPKSKDYSSPREGRADDAAGDYYDGEEGDDYDYYGDDESEGNMEGDSYDDYYDE